MPLFPCQVSFSEGWHVCEVSDQDRLCALLFILFLRGHIAESFVEWVYLIMEDLFSLCDLLRVLLLLVPESRSLRRLFPAPARAFHPWKGSPGTATPDMEPLNFAVSIPERRLEDRLCWRACLT